MTYHLYRFLRNQLKAVSLRTCLEVISISFLFLSSPGSSTSFVPDPGGLLLGYRSGLILQPSILPLHSIVVCLFLIYSISKFGIWLIFFRILILNCLAVHVEFDFDFELNYLWFKNFVAWAYMTSIVWTRCYGSFLINNATNFVNCVDS